MKVIEQNKCMNIYTVKRHKVRKVFIVQAGDTIEIEHENVEKLIEVLKEFVND